MEDDDEEEVNQLNCHCLWGSLPEKPINIFCAASEEIPILFMEPVSSLPFRQESVVERCWSEQYALLIVSSKILG